MKKIGKNNTIKEYNSLVDRMEQISKLRSTEPDKKCWKYLIIWEKFLMDLK